MRIPRLRFTTRTLMVVVGICALIFGITPIIYEYVWRWTVIRDVKRGQSERYSAIGFAKAGPRAMQALREALRSDQAKTRMAAAQSLEMIGPDAKVAVPDLIDTVIHDQDQLVRIYAATALGRIGPGAAEAVEPLIRLCQTEQDLELIASVIRAFHDLGPAAREALPLLASMAKDPECPYQVMAAWAMCRIGPDARAEASALVPKLLVQLTTDKNSFGRRFAADVLAEMGPAAEQAIPALSDATEDQDQSVRKSAAKALEAIRRELGKKGANELTPVRER
jgi:HEAT repeat protein